MRSRLLHAAPNIAGLVTSVLGRKLTVLQVSKLGHFQLKGEIDGGVEEVCITLEELGAGAITGDSVEPQGVSGPELIRVRAAVTAITDGKNFVVEVRAAPELRDTVRIQMEEKRCRLR